MVFCYMEQDTGITMAINFWMDSPLTCRLKAHPVMTSFYLRQLMGGEKPAGRLMQFGSFCWKWQGLLMWPAQVACTGGRNPSLWW